MKSLLILCLLAWPFVFCNSQSSYLDSVLNEAMYYDDDLLYMELDASNTFHFMYFNSSYNNKTFYAGREVANPQYYLSGQVSYFNSKGFFVGFGTSSGTWFSSDDNANYNNALVLGLAKSIKKIKWMRYNVSYSRYFGINKGLDFSSAYSNNLHLGLGARYKSLGIRSGFNLLFGSEAKATFSWDVYATINVALLKQGGSIKLVPELSFFYDSEEVEQNLEFKQQQNYSTKFGLLNTEISLPLMINLKDFDIEMGYTLNLPRSLDPNYSFDANGFFTISLGYIFSL
ncbi:MAG: hypothetical protein N4A71_19625 [Carboxylicivirga sp.]|nr:hypothetical protein [Carboxylicivirga sp.]